MRLLLIIITIFFLSFQLLAQVAAPSLDPSKENSLPSVTSLRYFSTLAVNYGTGELKTDDGDGDYTIIGGILALNLDGLGLEAYSKTGEMEGSFDESEGTLNFTRDVQTSQVGVSYILGDFLSIGVGQYFYTQKDEGDGTFAFKDESEEKATIISANIVISEQFFVGAGINSFTKTGTTSGSGSTFDKQELTWQENVWGAGLLLGDPGQFQVKAEVSTKASPETGKKSDGQVQSNGKRKSSSTTGILEIKSGEYFISYTSQTIKETEIDSQYLDHDNSGKKTDVSTIGIGYVNDEGLMLSAYSETKNEIEKTGSEDDDLKWTLLTINVGYNF